MVTGSRQIGDEVSDPRAYFEEHREESKQYLSTYDLIPFSFFYRFVSNPQFQGFTALKFSQPPVADMTECRFFTYLYPSIWRGDASARGACSVWGLSDRVRSVTSHTGAKWAGSGQKSEKPTFTKRFLKFMKHFRTHRAIYRTTHVCFAERMFPAQSAEVKCFGLRRFAGIWD